MNSFNYQFYCRQSKVRKNGLAPVELGITINGKRKFINLPYKCLPSEFNSKKQPKELADYIASIRTRINEILAYLVSSSQPLTAETLSSYLRSGGYQSFSVQNLFDEYIGILEKRVGKTIIKDVFNKYILVRELFYTIIDKEAECNSIAPSHVRTFKAICESRYKTSTVAGYLQKLKSILIYGVDNGRLKTNPFIGTKINKGSKDIDYLTESELDYIANLDIQNNSLRNVRDLFLFECYSGISYADIKNVKESDIREENGTYYIIGRRQKTGKEFTSVLLPGFLNLIEFERRPEKGFKGNVIQEFGGKFRFKCKSLQKINEYLKILQKLYLSDNQGVKSYSVLRTHLGRHTYATILANKYKCRMELVASALGDSLKVTVKHYARFLSETTVNEIGQQFRNA